MQLFERNCTFSSHELQCVVGVTSLRLTVGLPLLLNNLEGRKLES